MEKEFPSKAQFLLCEDIREEAHRKLNLVGVFAGDEVLLEGEESGKSLPSLAILAVFKEGKGEFNISTELLDPSGKPHGAVTSETRTVEIKNNKNMVAIFRWIGFLVPAFGDYTFTIKLDDKSYKYTFSIINSDK